MTALSSEAARARGRIGGLTRAALAPSPQAITAAARDARWQRYRDQVLAAMPELDPADPDVDRRAALLQRADMARLSQRAAKARRLRAEAARIEAELDAESARMLLRDIPR